MNKDKFKLWAKEVGELVGYANFMEIEKQDWRELSTFLSSLADLGDAPDERVNPYKTNLDDYVTKANRDWYAKQLAATKAELAEANKELEVERMRLCACGVVAMSNTTESAKEARQMHPDYRSASLSDVERAVDREMALRKELDEAKRRIKELEMELVKFQPGTPAIMQLMGHAQPKQPLLTPEQWDALAKFIQQSIVAEVFPSAYHSTKFIEFRDEARKLLVGS